MKYLFSLIIGVLSLSAFSQTVYERLEHDYNAGAFESCVDMEKAVDRFTKDRRDTLALNSFFFLGDAFTQTGNLEKALWWFEREKTMLQDLGMVATEDYRNSLSNLAYLYLQHGNYPSAGRAADELLASEQRLSAPTDDAYVSSMIDIADVYIAIDRLSAAEDVLRKTLGAQRRKERNRALILNKLGDLYSYEGQYSRAYRSLMEALDIHALTSGEDSPDYITTAINLGILYMNQGKYPQAEEIFEVVLSHLAPSDPAYAAVQNNQALVYQSLGQFQRAESLLENILAADSVTVGPMHPDFAITLSNVGLVYADRGDLQKAEQALNRALAIQRGNGAANTLSYAGKLNNLSRILAMSGSPARAVALLEEALVVFKRVVGKNSPDYATGAFNLGVAQWKAGDLNSAFRNLKTSAVIRAKVLGKNHPRYAESRLKIAEFQWHNKEHKEARESFGAVFENYYFQVEQTFPVLTEEEKSKFYYTNIRGAFDRFNTFATSRLQHDPSLAGDVYDYLINTKAAIMFATEKVRTAIMESGDSALIARYDTWQAAREQIAKLYSLNQQHEHLDSLLKAADVLEKELTRQSSAFESQYARKRYHWKEIRQSLKAGEAAVEVLRFKAYDPKAGGAPTDEIRYGFLVATKDLEHPEFIPLQHGNDLESKFLRYYRNNIEYKLSDAHSYRNYFEPLAAYLRARGIGRVFFSPDGVYNQVNLNSLQHPETQKFVIDEFDIRYVTNTRELAERSGETPAKGIPVLIGYPQFDLGIGEPDKGAPRDIRRGAGLSRDWRGGLLRYIRGDEGITALPGTQVEIEKIANLLGENSSVYTQASASETAARQVNSPAILHIATHGYFLEDYRPVSNGAAYVPSPLLNAGLILAGAENFLRTGAPINDHGDDGILTAFEAMNMDLDGTDLVVLSACETALGEVKNGEGVYGLQRAFKVAGASSMVMSLWNVDDDATQQLMTTFYSEMLKTRDRHQAFRIAQQKVKEVYPSPLYWGAFIMTGI